eukprot:TRINITY_DN41827_c0_g2_i1.p1 TRINITY_DN41827_c0_g2~~TRINITY_DN41827_c0_g2_i1.p1  ORF type:complete len:200 (-),score=-17.85 TRINITY_DN41827_c0_g2_i1:588-1187(-)
MIFYVLYFSFLVKIDVTGLFEQVQQYFYRQGFLLWHGVQLDTKKAIDNILLVGTYVKEDLQFQLNSLFVGFKVLGFQCVLMRFIIFLCRNLDNSRNYIKKIIKSVFLLHCIFYYIVNLQQNFIVNAYVCSILKTERRFPQQQILLRECFIILFFTSAVRYKVQFVANKNFQSEFSRVCCSHLLNQSCLLYCTIYQLLFL